MITIDEIVCVIAHRYAHINSYTENMAITRSLEKERNRLRFLLSFDSYLAELFYPTLFISVCSHGHKFVSFSRVLYF